MHCEMLCFPKIYIAVLLWRKKEESKTKFQFVCFSWLDHDLTIPNPVWARNCSFQIPECFQVHRTWCAHREKIPPQPRPAQNSHTSNNRSTAQLILGSRGVSSEADRQTQQQMQHTCRSSCWPFPRTSGDETTVQSLLKFHPDIKILAVTTVLVHQLQQGQFLCL